MSEKDIHDDEIRIIGASGNEVQCKTRGRWWVLAIIVAVLACISLGLWYNSKARANDQEPSYFEPIELPQSEPIVISQVQDERSYTEIKELNINDIVLRTYVPHNAQFSLHLGRPDTSDTSIVYIAQAADVRADNGGIVGAFVLQGTPKSWGLSKKGYCASIEGKVYIGVADNSPLFELATEKGGYFFRQYPLVSNGQLVENEPKGKSIRRAICDKQGDIFMVESLSEESFHDFAQALVDLGCEQAVYLVGSKAYGWAKDLEGKIHEFGSSSVLKDPKLPRNTSYIVWRRVANI